jgi:hypothetical protein
LGFGCRDEVLSLDDCLLCVEVSFETGGGGISFFVRGGSWMTRFDDSRGGTIVRLLPICNLLSGFNLFSTFMGTERTLAARRCPSSANPSYLSFRVCNELFLVGLGDGIPLTERGRGLARASRIAGKFEALTSRRGTAVPTERLSFEGFRPADMTEAFRLTTGAEVAGFEGATTRPSVAAVSEMASKGD